jgi:hypothetical protein
MDKGCEVYKVVRGERLRGDPGYIYIVLGYVSGEMGLGSMRCGFGFEKNKGIWGF